MTHNESLVSLQTVQVILLGKSPSDFQSHDNKRGDTVQEEIAKYCAYRMAGDSHEHARIGLTEGLQQVRNTAFKSLKHP